MMGDGMAKQSLQNKTKQNKTKKLHGKYGLQVYFS